MRMQSRAVHRIRRILQTQTRMIPIRNPCSERGGHKQLAQQWARGRAGASTSKIQILGNDPGKFIISQDKKYLYDANTKSFVGTSKTENKRLLNDPQVQRAIEKGLK